MTSRAKYLLLASLYAAQGLPFGFFTQAVPVQMRAHGASLGLVGLTSALASPWGLKFLWAPLVDRRGSARLGHRRGWILSMQACTVLLLLALAALGEPAVSLTALALVLLVNACAATQDIATDSLAVTLLSVEERGVGNGIQVAAYRVGMIVGGGALLALLDCLTFARVLLILALCLLLSTIPIYLFRESARTRVEATAPALWNGIVTRFESAAMRRFALLLATYKTGEALASSMLRPYLVDLGLSLSAVGGLLGSVGFGAGLVGSLAGGWAVTRLGRARALVSFGLGQSAALGSYVWLARSTPTLATLYLVIGLEHFLAGMATAALFTAMMDQCRPGHEGTDYTLMASIVALASGGAALISGFIAERLGYPLHFLLAACVSALSLAPLLVRVLRGREALPTAAS